MNIPEGLFNLAGDSEVQRWGSIGKSQRDFLTEQRDEMTHLSNSNSTFVPQHINDANLLQYPLEPISFLHSEQEHYQEKRNSNDIHNLLATDGNPHVPLYLQQHNNIGLNFPNYGSFRSEKREIIGDPYNGPGREILADDVDQFMKG